MEAWRRHRHLIGTSSAAIVSWIGLAALYPDTAPRVFSGIGSLWLALGMAYTHGFEYAYHRWVMHQGVRFLRGIQRKHLEHHRLFHGDRFATRDPGAFAKIPGQWFLFPAAFLLHYAMLGPLLAPAVVLSFLGGVVLHYVAFEVTHYFAHVTDNGFDRIVRHLPVLRAIRDLQLSHHRGHHETPDVDFNFNPPFAVDLALRTFCVGRLWMRRCGSRRHRSLHVSGSAPSLASGTFGLGPR